MTRKDYEDLAYTINTTPFDNQGDKEKMVERMIVTFKRLNPRFDEDLFKSSCGI